MIASFALLILAASPQTDRLLAEIPEGMEVGDRLLHVSNTGVFVPRMAITWSADGSEVAYSASREGEYVPVVGSWIGESCGSVSVPVAAGGRFAFVAGRMTGPDTAKQWLLVDDQEIGPEDFMGPVRISADGETIAYWTKPGSLRGNTKRKRKRTAQLAVARMRKSGSWRVQRGDDWFECSVEAPLISEDGSRICTIAVKKGRGSVVIMRTGRREKEISDLHKQVAALAMSADGSAVAYVADSELYFDGKRIAEGLIGARRPVVDARGKHVGYVAPAGERVTVGVDGDYRPVGIYDEVLELAFDAKGERLAFVANVGGHPSKWPPGYVEGGEWFVVVRPVSKDEDVDWQEGPRFDEIRNLVWDEESGSLAYCARIGEEWVLVCGERRSKPYDFVGPAHFEPGGASIGFGARSGRELWWKTLAIE